MTVLCPRCDRLHVVLPLGPESSWMHTADRSMPFVVGNGLHPAGKIICGKATFYVYERAA